MLVTDAVAWVRALFEEGPEGSVRARLRREASVDAPALIDLEFLSAARGLLATKLVTPIDRPGHGPLAWRAWELRANLTPYDASYVALAEMLGTALLTVDRRLACAPMIRCAVELATDRP